MAVLSDCAAASDRSSLDVKAIHAATPDISSFPMFRLDCVEAKNNLAEVALDLKNQVIEHVAAHNRERMEHCDHTYQDIADKLLAIPLNAEEIAVLKNYASGSHAEVRALNNEFMEQTVKRIEFLFANDYKHTPPETILVNTSWNWMTKMVAVQKYLEIMMSRFRNSKFFMQMF